MFNIYRVKDLNGGFHLVKPKKIYNRANLRLNPNPYKWYIPIEELDRVCKNKNFPKDFSKKIQLKILSFYSMLMYSNDVYLVDNPEALEIAFATYNSLGNSKDEEIKTARHNFLKSYLEYIIYSAKVSQEVRQSQVYREISSKWQETEFQTLHHKKQLNFTELKPILISSFMVLIEILNKNKQTKNDEPTKGTQKTFSQKKPVDQKK